MTSIIDLLIQDHREVNKLFEETSGVVMTGEENHFEILKVLRMHDKIEMTLLYPEARQAGLQDMVDQAEQEHQLARSLLVRYALGEDVLAELQTNIAEHAAEEEAEFFPAVVAKISSARLEALGARALAMKGNAIS